jgi:hypothetical protein
MVEGAYKYNQAAAGRQARRLEPFRRFRASALRCRRQSDRRTGLPASPSTTIGASTASSTSSSGGCREARGEGRGPVRPRHRRRRPTAT